MKIFESIFLYVFTFMVGFYSGGTSISNESVLVKAFCISITMAVASLIVAMIIKIDFKEEVDCITSFVWRLKKC